MWSAVRWSLAAAAVTLAFAVPASAQQRPTGDGGLALLTSSMRAEAPVLLSDAPALAFESAMSTSTAPLPVAMERQSQNVVLMIVGGAAMVVGSLISGDTGTIVMAGGGVLVLVGLFRYLN